MHLNATYIRERDQYREDIKEIVDAKSKLEKEKLFFTIQSKDTINKLNAQIKQLTEDLDKAIEDHIKADK